MTIYNLFWSPTSHLPPVLEPNFSSPTCFGAQLLISHLFWGPTSHFPPILGTISHLCFGVTDHMVWESFIFLSPVLGVHHHPSALGVISRLIKAFGVVSWLVLCPLIDYLFGGGGGPISYQLWDATLPYVLESL